MWLVILGLVAVTLAAFLSPARPPHVPPTPVAPVASIPVPAWTPSFSLDDSASSVPKVAPSPASLRADWPLRKPAEPSFEPLAGLLRDSASPEPSSTRPSRSLAGWTTLWVVAALCAWLARRRLRFSRRAAEPSPSELAHLASQIGNVAADARLGPEGAEILSAASERWPLDDTVSALAASSDPDAECGPTENRLRDRLRSGHGGKAEWGLLACIASRAEPASALKFWRKYTSTAPDGSLDTASRLALIELFLPKDLPAGSRSATPSLKREEDPPPLPPSPAKTTPSRHVVPAGMADLRKDDGESPLRRSPRLRVTQNKQL